MPNAVWPPGAKQRAYELRAQGMTIDEIAAQLATEFSHAPSNVTVYRWLASEEAKPLISQATERVRAIWIARTHDALHSTYDGLQEAIAARDAKAVDAWSRAIVNMTRGVVADKVEVDPPKQAGNEDELRELLKLHGVQLAPKE